MQHSKQINIGSILLTSESFTYLFLNQHHILLYSLCRHLIHLFTLKTERIPFKMYNRIFSFLCLSYKTIQAASFSGGNSLYCRCQGSEVNNRRFPFIGGDLPQYHQMKKWRVDLGRDSSHCYFCYNGRWSFSFTNYNFQSSECLCHTSLQVRWWKGLEMGAVGRFLEMFSRRERTMCGACLLLIKARIALIMLVRHFIYCCGSGLSGKVIHWG